jgi:hypothetical protein
MSVWVARVAFAFAALAPISCGSHKPAENPVLIADQRLSGSWRLQRFMPEVALDLPLQAVLSAETGNLTVTFSSGQYSATGPGVNLSGRYQVANAQGDTLELVLFDPDNVPRHFSAQFLGNALSFHANDKPWQGDGTLQRN